MSRASRNVRVGRWTVVNMLDKYAGRYGIFRTGRVKLGSGYRRWEFFIPASEFGLHSDLHVAFITRTHSPAATVWDARTGKPFGALPVLERVVDTLRTWEALRG